jgi:hypothetical protein
MSQQASENKHEKGKVFVGSRLAHVNTNQLVSSAIHFEVLESYLLLSPGDGAFDSYTRPEKKSWMIPVVDLTTMRNTYSTIASVQCRKHVGIIFARERNDWSNLAAFLRVIRLRVRSKLPRMWTWILNVDPTIIAPSSICRQRSWSHAAP